MTDKILSSLRVRQWKTSALVSVTPVDEAIPFLSNTTIDDNDKFWFLSFSLSLSLCKLHMLLFLF